MGTAEISPGYTNMGQRNIKRLYDFAMENTRNLVPRTADNTNGAIGGTAAVPEGIGLSFIASTDANQRIELPLNAPGTILYLFETTSVGYELITTTVGGEINTAECDGIGASREMNIPVATTGGAGMLLKCLCVSASAWIVLPYNVLGDVEVTIVQT